MNVALRTRRVVGTLGVLIVSLVAGEALAQDAPCPEQRRARYRVRIDSNPQQAKVYLTDKQCLLGVTPWEGVMPRGRMRITLRKDGHEPLERSFRVRRTRRLQEHAYTLVKKPDPPKIEVRADADQNVFNAEVWVDGQRQGQVPLLIEVAEGRHLVEVKKEGFESFTQWVETKLDARVTVNPVLKAIAVEKKGTILVEADVAGAEVYIDGQRHTDLTPTIIGDVVEGPHVIEVRKEPAMPWKQTVIVVADQTVKVSAELQATMGGNGGTVRVLSNVDGARVFLDGTEIGTVPVDIKDVSPGEHFIEVRADGYLLREERVTVNAGSASVLKLDLQPEAEAEVKETGIIKVVSQVAEANVFINGERVGTAPQEKEIPAGDHFVVVTKEGYKKFEDKVRLEAGQTITVSSELAAVGSLRILSTPAGAEVYIDGELVGQTPMNQEDIDAGEHVIKLSLPDYYEYEEQITVKGGERAIVSGKLEMIDTGPTPEQLAQEQRSLSSFGARALPLGRSTIDFAMGYPYYAEGQFTVGAGLVAGFPFDAGVVLRTFVSRTELALRSRWTLVEKEPFSLAVFLNVGGGGNFIDDSGRNSLFSDFGLLSSLTAFGSMTVTGRVYVNAWSDRHCQPMSEGSSTDEESICDDQTQFDEYDIEIMAGEIRERENDLRLMLSLIVEVAFRQRWSAWLLFEGAPFQNPRAAYTDLFNPFLLGPDIGTYARVGATYKF